MYNYMTLYIANLKGIICREYASNILKLSTFPDSFVTIESDKVLKDYNLSFAEIVKVNNLDLSYTYEIKDGLYLTNEERTIVDMIKYDSEGKLIEQSLETYLQKVTNFDKVYECAKYYDVLDKVKIFIEETEL